MFVLSIFLANGSAGKCKNEWRNERESEKLCLFIVFFFEGVVTFLGSFVFLFYHFKKVPIMYI